ncbi:MAG: hypothetical protein DSM106950_33165 [Stigonema ocellatum SAG 48.90 = DSM 106950]|nr:hypothetical protein [Stigonema ocellatum SAG 48.90 = DSM 106950]
MDSLKIGEPPFQKQGGSVYTMLSTKAIGLFAPVLAMAGWLAMSLPSTAVTATSYNTDVNASYYNEYRVCAARLLSVNVAAEAASQACATALRPRDVSSCVVKIQRRTQIPATDALSSCSRSRFPRDLASCAVGINQYSKEAVNPQVLDYCGRSLSPVRFAQCVVGLRAEIDYAPIRAMNTCIDASDRISGFLPSFIPASATPANIPTPVNIPTQENPSIPANPPGVSTPQNPGGATQQNPGDLTPVNPGSK